MSRESSQASSSSQSEEEDSDLDFHFDSDEAAEVVRRDGLTAYNEGRFNDALDHQYRVVRYFADKYGTASPTCGIYYLDYGLSLLRVLQGQSSVEDALKPRDEEAMETCFINLEVARVCFQRKEAEAETKGEVADVATEMALAETHDALAQLSVEKEDFNAALTEYEAELLIYRELQERTNSTSATVPPGRIIATLYGMADCYMKEADFDGAEERLVATLKEVASFPAGTIAAELVAELEERLEDAREMKGGKYKELQAEIQRQFVPDEMDQLPTAQEFYSIGGVAGAPANPFVSALPDGDHGNSHLSMPTSHSGMMLGGGLGVGEHSNSQSLSIFPPQGSRSNAPCGSNSNSAVVHHAPVHKKAKTGGAAQVAAAPRSPGQKRCRS